MKAKNRMLAILSVLTLTASITIARAENSWDDAIIFINPGHNGWTISSDRNLATINHGADEEDDTCGFFETNTNLHKAFALRDDLVAAGKTFRKDIYMSRTINGITAGKAYIDDDGQLQLAPTRVIAGYADYYEADYFISIHSNATSSDGTTTNYLLFLFNGTTSTSDDVDGNSKSMATNAWDYAIDNPLTWKSSSTYIYGDVSFYGEQTDSYSQYNLILNSSGSQVSYKGPYSYGLIVLCHDRAGYLVEGTFHSYQPERHRLLNPDYCRQEGLRYARAIRAWYGVTANTTGEVYGTVKDISTSLENDLYVYKSGTTDVYYPLNNVRVYLHDSTGAYVGSYKTDDEYNGVFAFTGLAPGTYYLNFKDITATTTASTSYEDLVVKIDVTADNTSFTNVCLSPSSSTSGTCDEDGTIYTGSITFTYEDGASEPNPSDDDEGSSGTTSTTTTASRRIFAYDLEAQANTSTTDGETTVDSYTVSFKTNITPTEFTLNFYTYDSETDTYDTTPIKSITYSSPSSYLSNGIYSVDVTANDIGTADIFRWSVTATAGAVSSFAAATGSSDSGLQFYSPWGVAVDDSPESPYFGTVYLANTNYSSSASSSSYKSKTQGIYRFDPTDESLDSDSGYDLGLSWTTTSGEGPRRVAITDDGRIFICDYGTTNSGIYYVDPKTMSATKFYTNSSSEITQITALGVYGSGSDTKLYAIAYSSSGSTVYRYDIGESNTWSSASASASYTLSYITAAPNNIAPVDGGFWVAQYKSSSSSSAPFLIYYDEGTNTTTFTSYSIDSSSYNSLNGAVATYDQEGLVAHSYNSSTSVSGVRLIYYTADSDGTITYDVEGTHATTTLQGRSSNAYAFDYAGNLYAVTSNNEIMSVYAIPTSDNSCTTMATYSGTAGSGYLIDYTGATITESDEDDEDEDDDDDDITTTYSDASRRIFAYDLTATLSQSVDDTYDISFKTNIAAEEFTLNFYTYDSDADSYDATPVKSINYTGAASYLTDDTYSVQISDDDIGSSGKFRWSVTATAGAVSTLEAVTSSTDTDLIFYSPWGVAVDSSPDSPYFGTVYVANSVAGSASNSSRTSTTRAQGIFRLDPTDEHKDNGNAFNSYSSWSSTSSGYSPMRIDVASDGRIYVSDRSSSSAGIVYINPSTGEGSGWGSKTNGLSIRGSGDDTQILAVDLSTTYSGSSTYYPVNRYDIGSETTGSSTASDTYKPSTSGITDSQYSTIAAMDGGFWACQRLTSGSSTTAIPVVFHYNESTSTVDYEYHSSSTSHYSYRGAVAVSEDLGLMVHSYSTSSSVGGIRLVEFTVDSNGNVTVDDDNAIVQQLKEQGNGSTAFDFDYAGNLYAVTNYGTSSSSYGECLTIYAIPTSDNSRTTMATYSGTAGSGYILDFSETDSGDDDEDDDDDDTVSNYSSLYSNASRRIFAYDLVASLYGSATGSNSTSDTYSLSFKTNIAAEEFTISLYKYSSSKGTYSSTATKTFRYTSASNYLSGDTYTVYLTSDDDQLGLGTIWRWSVTAVAGPVSDFGAVSSSDNTSLQYYSPFGVAVDDSPESPYFGTVYVTNTNYSTSASSSNYKSKKQGLYRLSPTDESLDDDTCYDLDISWTTTSGEGPRRVAVADDGRIFICDYGTTNSGIYYVDPETMKATAWFSGATNTDGSIDYGDTHLGGMTCGLGVRGGNSDTQVYAIDCSKTSGLYKYIYRYDIGSDNVWTTATPVEYEPLTTWVANVQSNIAPVDGGFWVCQYRSSGNSTAAYPMLFYIDESSSTYVIDEDETSTASDSDSSTTGSGTLLFQSKSIDESGYNSQNGAVAVYEPEGLVASSYNTTSNSTSYAGIRLISYSISDEVMEYSVDGIYDTSDEQGSRSNAFAFDYAGNLYAVSNNSEIVTVYAIPTNDNSTTTMATETNSSTTSAYIGFTSSDLTSGIDSTSSGAPVVKIYPNPASEQVTVASSAEIDIVAVYTVGNGALVMKLEGVGEKSAQLDVSGLARGIYIVSVDGSTHKLIVK